MGYPINGDLVPSVSGRSHLGVDATTSRGGFNFNSIRPFGHVHMESGIFHHASSTGWESGVLRFNAGISAFEVSVNGGISFNSLATGGVSSVGVIGGANLTGNIDFTSTSGFIIITDAVGASPISFNLDIHQLSGLYRFPTQGFNGRVVNALTDANGTEAQGVINVVGASGIYVDIIGQTMTIVPGSALPRCFAATFGAATSWTVTHNFNTTDVSVEVFDDSSPRVIILPDQVEATSTNVVTISFNVAQGGRAVVIAC